jgi:glyoxylase-like metal-dependent hydrolase (beta-lactamase superfamily II)
VLTPVADGVFVHRSELLRNLTVVVHGRAGALVVDPGITATELACLGDDLRASGQSSDVAAALRRAQSAAGPAAMLHPWTRAS